MTRRQLLGFPSRSCLPCLLAALMVCASPALLAGGAPDMATVPADLRVPELTDGPPGPGKRVRFKLFANTPPVVLYLPTDWTPERKFPVIVELAGNGNFKNAFGDISTGLPEGSSLGYGLSEGRGCVWACLPFLNHAGDAVATNWWGNAPDYQPDSTVAFLKRAVPALCDQFSGDPGRVILCGFSRGSIAANAIGLHDDGISGLWRAFVCYSHYDGVREGWPFAGSERPAARERLARLAGRPQLICHESVTGEPNLETSRRYLDQSRITGDFTFLETGFRNHNGAWVLRPSAARSAAREWLSRVLRAGKPNIPSQSDFDRIRRVHSEHANELFENVLKSGKIAPLQGGFAHLWLNRDLAEGNRLLREARLAIIKQEGGTDTMTPAIAGSEHVKWQMRTWNRIYQLYNSRGRFHPGRLDKETQAMIEELFWLYVCDKSRFERSAPRYVMSIQGSENHEMMHYSNTLLALQALKDSPAYKDRKLPDDRGVAEHYAAWNEYYKLYCVERARHGLLVELFSGYGKYTMPELFNLHDFAGDPVLRLRMGKLLDLIWADWAIGQLNGVRGGGRLRIYQGDPEKPEVESSWGRDDMWRQMSQFFLDSGTWWKNPGGYHPNPIIGYPWVLATTQYRLPDVIMDLATDVEGRGEYTYVARRLAKQQRTEAKDVPVTFAPWYALDPEDPRMLSYDHCTPDYVMGSLIIDPTLPQVSSHDYQKGQPLQEGYPSLTAQNRYHGIVFSTDVNARVVPQCEGLANGKTYGQQQAVQYKNVLLVQRHARARQTGDMRVLFGKEDMKERLVERDRWLILKEGNAWLGIKGFSRTQPNESCGHKWDNNVFLRMKDGNAPVAFITGRAQDYPDIAAFAAYLKTFSGKPADGCFTLAGGATEKVSLSLHLTCKSLPEVNGTPVDLRPKMLFDSPFLRSEHGSGIVTIRKGPRELKIEMTDDRNVTRGAYPESTDLKD